MYIGNFHSIEPPYQVSQNDSLEWLSTAHHLAQKDQHHTKEEYLKLLHRVGCSEQQINQRYFFVPDVTAKDWNENKIYPIPRSKRGVSMHHRHEFYHKTVQELFNQIYESRPYPDDMIHVSCTGYVSPSAAQLVALKSTTPVTVTHSYHMGCYGAFPAMRMASGFLANQEILGEKRAIDLVHTELCSLHMNPEDPTLEQMVIQSLFADGCIAYRMSQDKPSAGFKILSLYEEIIPHTSDAMEWMVSDWGMKMTLSKDVPFMVGTKIREFTRRWIQQRGFDLQHIQKNAIFAVHPGGPKIIDQAAHHLELRDDQVDASRRLLRRRGNMSSATLPHVWESIASDNSVLPGTQVVSFAFGPGLTICAGLMEKL